MVPDEGRGVGGVSEIFGRGGPQAPAVRLCGSSEVTPAGVGIRVAGHPRDRRQVRTGRGGYRKVVPTGIVSGGSGTVPRGGKSPACR